MEEEHLTGHMYYHSPYETDDDCGNCDGAHCEYCRCFKEITIWLKDMRYIINIVIGYLRDTYNYSYDEAKEIFTCICDSGDRTYEDEKHDILWEIESTDDIIDYYNDIYDYLTTEVWVIKAIGGGYLGVFDNEDDAERAYYLLKGVFEAYTENKSKSIKNHCSGTMMEVPVGIMLRKDYIGNITLGGFKN